MHSTVHGILASPGRAHAASIADMRFVPALSHHLGANIRLVGETLSVDDTIVFELKVGDRLLWCRQFKDGLTIVSTGSKPLAEIRTEKDGAIILRSADSVSRYSPEGVIERIEHADGRIEFFDDDGNLAGVEDPSVRQSVVLRRREPLVKIRAPRPKKRRVAMVPPQLGIKPPAIALDKKPLVDTDEISVKGPQGSGEQTLKGAVTAVSVKAPATDMVLASARMPSMAAAACFLDFALLLALVDSDRLSVSSQGNQEPESARSVASDETALPAVIRDTDAVVVSGMLCVRPTIPGIMHDVPLVSPHSAESGLLSPDMSFDIAGMRYGSVNASYTLAASAVGMLTITGAESSEGRHALSAMPALQMVLSRSSVRPPVRPPLGATVFAPFALGPGACTVSEVDSVRVRQPQFPTIPISASPVTRREEIREPELIARADLEKTDEQSDDDRERRGQGDESDQAEDEEHFA